MAIKEVQYQAQIKSRERVRSLAEVFTPERIVNAMLDLVGPCTHEVGTRFLEPAAGNGNFLVKILERKLNAIAKAAKPLKGIERRNEIQFLVVWALANIYAVDICPENVSEAKARLLTQVQEFMAKAVKDASVDPRFWEAVNYVLDCNVQLGDMLNGTAKISFIEFSLSPGKQLSRKRFMLDDLTETGLLSVDGPAPVSEWPPCSYLELALSGANSGAVLKVAESSHGGYTVAQNS